MGLVIFIVSMIIGFIASTIYIFVGRWIQNESITEKTTHSKYFVYKIMKEYKKSNTKDISYRLYRRYIFLPTYTYISDSYTRDVHSAISLRNDLISRDSGSVVVKKKMTKKELKVEVI